MKDDPTLVALRLSRNYFTAADAAPVAALLRENKRLRHVDLDEVQAGRMFVKHAPGPKRSVALGFWDLVVGLPISASEMCDVRVTQPRSPSADHVEKDSANVPGTTLTAQSE